MQEIRIDIRRSILSIPTYFATGGMLLIIILGVGTKSLFPENAIKQGLMAYYHAEILYTSLSSDIVLMAVPIICTLPYTTAFLDEYTSGFIKVYLMKCDKSRYIKGKVIAPLVSGGVVLAMGILVFFFLSKLAYLPMEILNEYAIPPFMNILMKAIQFFFTGALWASVGSLFANLSLSKYMAYASPFVFFYVLVILQERYFTELYILNPKEWIIIENPWVLNEWGAIVLMVLLILITCLVNAKVIERKIEG